MVEGRLKRGLGTLITRRIQPRWWEKLGYRKSGRQNEEKKCLVDQRSTKQPNWDLP